MAGRGGKRLGAGESKAPNQELPSADSGKAVNLGRHRAHCTICSHPDLHDIEAAFIAWKSPGTIAVEFGLADRSTVYRHANALGLNLKRRKNIRAALERFIERADEAEVTAASVVSAIQAYAKINDAGAWVEKVETVSLNDLYARMTTPELEKYAVTGEYPSWFRAALGATADDSQEMIQ